MEQALDRRVTATTVAKYAAIVFVVLVTFPGDYEPVRTGLDPSYRYALNELAGSELVFGRDVAFTFGPLGYLLIPLDLDGNLQRAIVVWLAVHALFAACLVHAARSAWSTAQVVLFASTYTAAMMLGLPYEYHLLVVTGLLVVASLHGERSGAAPGGVAGALAALCLFMKFTLGVAALTIVLAGEVVRWSQRNRQWPPAQFVSVAAYVASVALLTVVHFESPQNLLTWAATSFELAAGFSSAMSLPAHSSVLAAGVVVLLIVFFSVLRLMRGEPAVLIVGFIFSLAILLSFKHGFVRQDVHITNFFPFAIVVLGLLALVSRELKSARLLAVGVFASVTLAALAYSNAKILDPAGAFRAGLGMRGMSNLWALVTLADTRQYLEGESGAHLAANRLPEEWVSGIRQHGGSIDAFPWEITYAPANDLGWNPNPVLQTYSAYTATLDDMSAAKYGSEEAPDFVVAEFKNIDMRHPLLGAPATVRELLRNYTLVDGQTDPGRMLLRRVEPRFAGPSMPTRAETVFMGEWVDVPRTDLLLFAEIELRLTLRGRIREALFRVEPVSIEIVYADGHRETHRLVPATARNGLLMNFLPTSLDDWAGLYLGSSRSRVARFRIGGTGALVYEPGFVVTWKAADYAINAPTRMAEAR
jgi:hypothetical protein